MLRCTHIEIPQVERTHAVVLSKPAWMWGCEIGANACGVVGGNEAVSSLLAHELGEEPRLLGMDLLRLALERGATARAAVGHLTSLLEEHGQGGACEEGGDWTYENGFLLADAGEAFVVETAGTRHWAVERVPPGKGRNISNGLSIRTGVESCSAGLKELCVAKGWWDGEGPFDWKRSVGAGGRAHAKLDVRGRERAGADHLAAAAGRVSDGSLPAGDVAGWLGWMAGVLRDEESGICFRSTHGFMSTGSQISWLARGGGHTASHFFTAASDPLVACYKRWTFGDPAAAAAGDGGSLALWRRWRSIDLAGRSVPEAMRRALLEIEAEAVSAAERGGASEFSGSVARELELISSFAV